MKWIEETGGDYIAYSQGFYYKVNNAVLWRKGTNAIVLRNTWTGEERIIWIDEIFKTNRKEVLKALNKAKDMVDNGIIEVI